MVRLSELKSTAQNSRPTKAPTALPDDIITQREDAKQAGEEDEEDEQEEDEEGEQEAVVPESRPRRRRPTRPPEAAAKVEPEEKFRGKRQKDFDISEQKESSDEESQKKDRTRAAEEPWTQSQQKLLELALQQYPKGSSDRWDKIAKCVPSKSKVGEAGKERGLCAGFRTPLKWLRPAPPNSSPDSYPSPYSCPHDSHLPVVFQCSSPDITVNLGPGLIIVFK